MLLRFDSEFEISVLTRMPIFRGVFYLKPYKKELNDIDADNKGQWVIESAKYPGLTPQGIFRKSIRDWVRDTHDQLKMELESLKLDIDINKWGRYKVISNEEHLE